MAARKSLIGLMVASLLSQPVCTLAETATSTTTDAATAIVNNSITSPMPVIAKASNTVDDLVTEAKSLYGKSDFEPAQSKLEDALAIDPGNSQANYWLGQTFIKKGDKQKGIEYIERSVELMGDNSRLWQALGQVYGSVDANDKAEKAFIKAIELAPRNLDAQLDLGRLYVKLNRRDEAITQFNNLISKNRNSPQAVAAASFQQTLLTEWAEAFAVAMEQGKPVTDIELEQGIERSKQLILSGKPVLALPVLNGLMKARPKDPQVHFWFGRAYFLTGDVAEGLRLIRISAELAPDNLRLQSTLGAAFEEAGQDDEALAIYQRIFEVSDEELLRLDVQRRLGLLKGRRFEANGQYAQAAEEYLNLLDVFPQNIGLIRKLIDVYTKLGKPGEVDRYFEKAMAIRPDDPELYLSLSIAHRQRGDVLKANEYLARALELDKQGVIRDRALQSVGFRDAMDALQRKDYTAALDILNKILVAIPKDPLVYANLGETYRLMEDDKKAEDAYVASLKYAPDNMEVRLRLARIYAKQDREDDVLDMLESIAQDGRTTKQGQEALRTLLSMEKNIIKRGKRLLDKGDLAGAEMVFRRLLSRSPDSAQGHYWLGQVNLRREKFDEGLADIQRSVELSPQNPGIKQALAMAYEAAGMLSDAERAYLETMAMAPTNLGVRARLVKLYQRMGEEAKAQEQLEYVVKNAQEAGVDRRDVLMQLGLQEGLGLLKNNQPLAALVVLNRLLALIPDAIVYTNIGVAQEQIGNKTAAITAYQKAMELAPADASPRFKLGMLYSSAGNIDDALTMLEPIAQRKNEPLAADAKIEVRRLYNIWVAEIVERFTLEPTRITDEEVEQAIGRSKTLVYANMLDAAEPLLDILYLRRPKNPEVNYWLGQVAMKQKRYDDGIAYITRSTALAPTNLPLRLKLADAYEEAGQRDKLINHWLKTLAAFPGRANLYLKLATAYEYQSDTDKSRAAIIKAVEFAPDGPDRKEAIDRLGLTKGSQLLKEKKWDEALVSLNAVLSVVPDDATTHIKVGDAYVGLNDYERAIDAYRIALAQDEKNISVLLKLAEIYQDAERNDEAIETYEILSELPLKTRERRKVDAALDNLYSQWSIATVALIKGDVNDGPLDTEAVIERSRHLSLKNRYSLARPVLEAYVGFFPEDSQANYWLGQAMLKDKDVENGLSYIKKSTELAPDNLRLREFYGLALENKGRGQAAVDVYDDIIRKGDDDTIVNSVTKRRGLLLARKYEREGNIDAAINELKQLSTRLPDDVSVWLARGDLYGRATRYGDAAAMYQQALSLDSDNAEIYMHQADVFSVTNEPESARDALINAVRYSKPGQNKIKATALDRLGMIKVNALIKQKRYNDALAMLKSLNQTVPNEPIIFTSIADAFVGLRQIKNAEDMYERAIAVAPRDMDAQYGLARLYVATNQQVKAIETLEQALDLAAVGQDSHQLEELLVSLYADRADKLRRSNKIDEAITLYQKQIEQDPSDARAYFNMGVTYKAMRKVDESIAAFENVIKYQPDNYAAYANLSRLYAMKNRLDKAIDASSNAIALTTSEDRAFKDASDLTLLLVQKLVGEKKTGHALRELFSLRERDPAKVESHYYLGILYSQQGSLEQAIESYKEVTVLNPDNAQVRFNLGVLYERTSDYDLALDQYNAIVNSKATGLIVERARLRLEAVLDQLSPFDAKMSYTTTQGETELSTLTAGTFNSTLSIDLKLNARPHKNLLLSIGESVSYAANHNNQTDSLASTLKLDANLNFEDIFFSAGGSYNESHGLLVEELRGSNINLYTGSTLRFKRLFGFLDSFERNERLVPIEGVSNIERVDIATADAAPKEEKPDDEKFTDQNDALRNALESLKDSEIEEIKTHVVKEGDTLWDIANILLDDPYLWPELWYVNPNILNPHLIYPNDKISLVYVDGKPVLMLVREGQEVSVDVLGVEEGLALFKQGVAFMVAEKFEQAIEAFKKILHFVPDDLLSNIYIGIAYTGLGDYAAAESVLLVALKHDEDNIMAMFKLAAAYQGMERLDDAIRYYEHVRDLDADGYYGQRSVAILASLYKDRALIAATGLSPSSPPEVINTVITYVNQLIDSGDRAGAELVLKEMLSRVPDNIEANVLLGRIYVEQEQYVEALPYLENCHAQAQDHVGCSYLLANVYEATGKLADAESLYFSLLGAVNIDEALMWDVQYHLGIVRGRRFMKDGDYNAAIEEFVSLTSLFPDDIEVLLLMGDAYIKLGMTGEAIAIYEGVVGQHADNAGAMLILAELYLLQGSRDKALVLLKQVVALNPDDIMMRKLLLLLGFQEGLDLIKSEDYGKALDIFNAMRDIAPNDPLVLLNIGVIYQLQGRFIEAESLFLEVIEADPGNLTARMLLGLLYADMDQLAEAIFELEKALSMGRGTLVEQEAERLLDKLRLKELEKQNALDAGEPVSKTLSAQLNYSEYVSSGVSFFETFTYGANLSFTYPGGVWGNWSLSYGLSDVSNKHEFGRDYAYISDTYSLRVARPILPSYIQGLSGGISFARKNNRYKNIDTHALFGLGINVHRYSVTDSVGLNINYRLHDRLSLSLSRSTSSTDANLPTGFVYNRQGVPVARQAATLGDFKTSSTSLNLRFTF